MQKIRIRLAVAIFLMAGLGLLSAEVDLVQAAQNSDPNAEVLMSLAPAAQIVSCLDPAARTTCADGLCSTSIALNACDGHGGIVALSPHVGTDDPDTDSRPAATGVSRFRIIGAGSPPPATHPVAAADTTNITLLPVSGTSLVAEVGWLWRLSALTALALTFGAVSRLLKRWR